MIRYYRWCKTCHIPLLQEQCGIYLKQKRGRKPNQNISEHKVVEFPSKVKPVGRKEYEIYKSLFGQKHNLEGEELNSRFPKILFRSRNFLYSEISNGEPHLKLKFHQDYLKDWKLTDREVLSIDSFSKYRDKNFKRSKYKFKEHFLDNSKYRKRIKEGNIGTLQELEEKAIKFINKVKNKKRGKKTFVSFSGGKDSAVTAYLVKKALGDVDLLFSNTDIEYQETLDYIKSIKTRYSNIFGNLIEAKSKNNFLDLCNILGPPSRTMRWCCSTQKAAPVNQYYSYLSSSVISFDGIRREESNARSDYQQEHQNTKLQQQYSAYPILEWAEIDVWLFILWKDFPLNPLYQEGFARIGCWACPNNGLYDTYLFQKLKPEKAELWYQTIDNYLKKISRETDHQYSTDYIPYGEWKGRRVKYENKIIGDIHRIPSEKEFDIMEEEDPFITNKEDISEESLFEIEESPCTQANLMIIELDQEFTSESFEFLSIFGPAKKIELGNKTLVKIQGKKIVLEYFEGSKKLKYQTMTKSKLERNNLRNRLLRQLNKSFNCIKCAACVGVCSHGAIQVSNKKFSIDISECVHCLECTSGKLLKMGCVALHYKRDRLLVNRQIKSVPSRNEERIVNQEQKVQLSQT